MFCVELYRSQRFCRLHAMSFGKKSPFAAEMLNYSSTHFRFTAIWVMIIGPLNFDFNNPIVIEFDCIEKSAIIVEP